MLAPPNKRSTPLPPTASDGAGMPLLFAYPAIMLSLAKWLKPLMRKKPPTMIRPTRNKMGKIVAITPPFYDLGCGYVAGADYTPGNGTQAEFSQERQRRAANRQNHPQYRGSALQRQSASAEWTRRFKLRARIIEK